VSGFRWRAVTTRRSGRFFTATRTFVSRVDDGARTPSE
jgi:hypothetical protein